MSETPTPGPALTVRQAAGRIVDRQVRLLLTHEPEVRRGDDPEAVHQMRVATRRLRAALAVFRGILLPPRRARRRRIRWLAQRLGQVRDQDVIIALLEKRHLKAVRGKDAVRLATLLAGLQEQRLAAQTKLERSLRRGRYKKLRGALVEFAAQPRFGGDADLMAARFFGEAIGAGARGVAQHQAMLEAEPSPEALHALRIEFKRLRYVLDFHAETCGPVYEAERKLARAVQDCLGELHDHDLLLGWLAEGADFFAGPWRQLPGRLAAGRQKLFRRFARLRREWEGRTVAAPTVAPIEEPRLVSLEPAPVTLRLVKGLP